MYTLIQHNNILHTVGVSLKVQGVTIPNISLVDVRDILYRTARGSLGVVPSNANPELHDESLLCITDLVDCCGQSRTQRGDWYYPNGTVVQYDTDGANTAFRRNRGPNEILNGRQFYGSIRLFRRWRPSERGRFYCELPSAASPTVNQTLYVYIEYCELVLAYVQDGVVQMRIHNLYMFSLLVVRIEAVTISSGSNYSASVGDIFSLTCSATIHTDDLPSDVQAPTFRWYFGTNDNVSLPSGVTSTATVLSRNNAYNISSNLQFSPLSQLHAGKYTCHPGAKRLARSVNITIIGMQCVQL